VAAGTRQVRVRELKLGAFVNCASLLADRVTWRQRYFSWLMAAIFATQAAIPYRRGVLASATEYGV
jgi:hypothetical protein